MALEVDGGTRYPPHEMGWLIVVMVVVARLCAVQMALMKESGNQSGTRTVRTPSNQVFFWEWTGCVVVVGRMVAVTACFLRMLVWALPYEVHLAVEYDHNVCQGTENVDLESFDGGPLVDL